MMTAPRFNPFQSLTDGVAVLTLSLKSGERTVSGIGAIRSNP